MGRRHFLALPAGPAGAILLPVRRVDAASRAIARSLETFEAGLLTTYGGAEVIE